MNKKSKNVLLLVVLIAIIGIAVGYAALSQSLVLKGTATVKGASEWSVHFKDGKVERTSDVGVSDETIVIDTTDGLTGTFGATLEPGASVSYRVTVINDGSIGAVYQNYEVTDTNTTDYVTCEVSKATDGDVLAINGTHDFLVTLSCKEMDNLPADEVTESFTVTFNYSQEVNGQN